MEKLQEESKKVEAVRELCNTVFSYCMDIQRNPGCRVTKANTKRMVDGLVEFGMTKAEASAIEKTLGG